MDRGSVDDTCWRLDRSFVHLNHGSYGACPVPVLDAQDGWRDDLERDPTGFFTGGYFAALDAARERLASFVGADPAGLVFVPNATTGVNAVLRSWERRLTRGDEILVTDHTYAACRNVVDATAARTGARVVVARLPFPVASAGDVVEAVVRAAGPRSRLALVDHVTSSTALMVPVAAIVDALEPAVAVLVDGAHAPGMVPLDLDRLGASYVVGNCHKWLCAPKGAGYLWARTDHREGLEPVVISHGWNGRSRGNPNRLHELFDWPGTFDPSAWLAVPDAIDTVGGLRLGGWPEVMASNRALALAGRDIVCDALGIDPPCPDELIGAMAAAPMPAGAGGAAEDLRRWLREVHRIVVAVSPWPGPGGRLVRWSAQQYNHLGDYERLGAALAAAPTRTTG